MPLSLRTYKQNQSRGFVVYFQNIYTTSINKCISEGIYVDASKKVEL